MGYSIEQIIEAIQRWSGRYVVITGGEPMVDKELLALAASVSSYGKHITIETAGICFVPNLACDLMSISPKLSNSMPAGGSQREDSRINTDVLRRLMESYEYQLKFVEPTLSHEHLYIIIILSCSYAASTL